MSPPDPTDQSKWHLENFLHSESWATCSRCGVQILRSHLTDGVCLDTAGCDETLNRNPSWRQEYMCKPLPPEPVAMVRLEDGSQVVAFAPAGLEVRAFGAEDLDERGMPRWKP